MVSTKKKKKKKEKKKGHHYPDGFRSSVSLPNMWRLLAPLGEFYDQLPLYYTLYTRSCFILIPQFQIGTFPKFQDSSSKDKEVRANFVK